MTMAEAVVKVDYLSTGTNRFSLVADWDDAGQVAFGANHNVCLWDPTVSQHLQKATFPAGE